jgi:excisionase family DNA binding protein
MSAALATPPSGILPEEEQETAAEASRAVARLTGRGAVRVEAVPDGKAEPVQTFILPAAAVQLLTEMLVHLGAGRPVAVIPEHAELTTQEAADFLNVSRPWIVKLVERGELPHRMVGTHRRILFSDLRAYKEGTKRTRHQALDELASIAQAMGDYE